MQESHCIKVNISNNEKTTKYFVHASKYRKNLEKLMSICLYLADYIVIFVNDHKLIMCAGDPDIIQTLNLTIYQNFSWSTSSAAKIKNRP